MHAGFDGGAGLWGGGAVVERESRPIAGGLVTGFGHNPAREPSRLFRSLVFGHWLAPLGGFLGLVPGLVQGHESLASFVEALLANRCGDMFAHFLQTLVAG